MMDLTDVEKHNRKIARFMGGEIKMIKHKSGFGRNIRKWKEEVAEFEDPYPFAYYWHPVYSAKVANLKFHISWEWLMPVLEKIEEDHDYFSGIENTGIGTYDFSITKWRREPLGTDMLELPQGLLVRTDERACQLDNPKLEAVYKGCLRFINWVNEKD